MSHLRILKQLHEECINHGNQLLYILSSISPDEYAELLKNFSYDIEHLFVKSTIEYNVRVSEDRLYVINSICSERDEPAQGEGEGEGEWEGEPCHHDIVTDLIDIDPDRSMTITYCTQCEKTFR